MFILLRKLNYDGYIIYSRMKAIILAGGRGERLKPLTDKLPKPMLKIAGKPVLEHIVDFFKKDGITDLIFSLYYLPGKITSYFGNGSKFGVRINYILEETGFPLGTAGAIVQAQKYIKNTFIVTYGDILRELDIGDMLRQYNKDRALATLAVYKNYSLDPKSMIQFDKKNEIDEFIERPKKEKLKKEFVWSNASFYIFGPEIFDYLPKNRPSDFGRDIFPKLIASGRKVVAYKQKGFFLDVGDIKKLKEVENYFLYSTGELTIA